MSTESLGKYQLIKRLATGGMAQIYLARQSGPEGFQKQIVVKRILPHLAENEEFVRMFLQEARIAARLNHPNVVQIFDFGQADDSYFIAMEYIHGEDVRRAWKRAEAMGQTIPLALVVRIVTDACAGLDYAHKKADERGQALNIVHRDVSPQNILVTFEGGVKVVDFGIAKAADQATVTRSGVLKGKYSYMSPEQAAGQRVDKRTDIFALGIVLYELLTGMRLFKRSNDVQTLQAVIDCKVVPPSEVDSRVPKDLDPIVMRALAKDARERYQEAAELQMALENWLIANRLPGATAHLAAFMQELYADRLRREQEEGQLLVEELRPVEDPPEKATPSKKAKGSSRTGSVLRKPTDPAATSLSRPERSSRSQAPSKTASRSAKPDTLPPETSPQQTLVTAASSIPSVATLPGGGPNRFRALIAAATLGGVAIGALGAAYALFWRDGNPHTVIEDPASTIARVRINSDPPGASVRVDGTPVEGSTPLELKELPPGLHAIVVSREGFREHEERIDFPDAGLVVMPLVRLEPLPTDEPVEDAGAGATVQAELVELSIRSVPDGAYILVDGKEVGRAPAMVKVAQGAAVKVAVGIPGYFDVDRVIRVGKGPTQQEAFILRKRPVVHAGGGGGGGGGNDVDERPPKGVGVVRFAAFPWAEVSCNNQKFGDTPFPEKQLPAGTYECVFVNRDLAKTQTRTIKVEPNQRQNVIVKF